jgi:hypothetical protein
MGVALLHVVSTLAYLVYSVLTKADNSTGLGPLISHPHQIISDPTQTSWYKALDKFCLPRLRHNDALPRQVTGLPLYLRRTDLQEAYIETHRLHSLIAEAQTRLAPIQKVVNDFECVIPPIRRLLNEIFLEIFQPSVDIEFKELANAAIPSGRRPLVYNGPWSVTYTCRKRRDMAFSTSK